MGKVKDLIGQRFGRLTVVKFAGIAKSGNAMWKCQCDCGRFCTVKGGRLTSGRTKSCGCLRTELRTKLNTVHRMWGTKIYSVWRCMINRCTNKNFAEYFNYGGRGITVCEEWRNNFQAFYDYVSKLEHFGEEGYTLDRINNNGNYEPDNVRWATRKEQNRNRRGNIVVNFEGKEMILSEVAEQSGINHHTLLTRYQRDWRGEKLFQPVKSS